MNRFAVIAVFVLLFGSENASGQSPISAADAVQLNSKIELLLDQKRDMVFNDATLEHLTAYLTAIGIPTVIDERALDDYGLGKDMPIQLNQHAIRTRDGLDLLMRAVDLAWGVRDGRLIITTTEGAEEDLITRVYDVRNLIELAPATYWSGSVERGRTVTAYRYDFDSLIEVITNAIQPDSWDYLGGAGAIEPYYTRRMRTLVVAQTYGVHRQLQALLNELAKHGGSRPLRGATADRSTFHPQCGPGGTIHASRLRTTAGRHSSD